jgi:hypothetical protein
VAGAFANAVSTRKPPACLVLPLFGACCMIEGWGKGQMQRHCDWEAPVQCVQ